jgi:hypothetical protein
MSMARPGRHRCYAWHTQKKFEKTDEQRDARYTSVIIACQVGQCSLEQKNRELAGVRADDRNSDPELPAELLHRQVKRFDLERVVRRVSGLDWRAF